MDSLKHWGVAAFIFVSACFLVLFLGGLASAWIEVEREKKAGKVPSRPAWEGRSKRRAVPWRERLRARWWEARYPGTRMCWCCRGVLAEFVALDGGTGVASVAGVGCAAWEVGDPLAVLRHDAAGGYARTPFKRGESDKAELS
ncbi:hypothetical protein [Nocardioides sp.]|uniref:hypothetical protein n=1 Tax=Nocardioides sp. TaxID=35761 RepID=UPI0039E2A71C